MTIRQRNNQSSVIRQRTSAPERVHLTPTARTNPSVAPAAPQGTAWNAALELGYRQALELFVGAQEFPADAPLIAVIVPVLGRPARVRPLVESFTRATLPGDAVLVFVAQTSDVDEVAAIRACGQEPVLVGDVDRSWARKINRGYESTSAPWLLLGADDLEFRCGWVDTVRKMLRTHAGVIGTNDLGNEGTMKGTHSTHPLVRRAYADHCGTVDERGRVVHQGYDHNFPDTELVATAVKRGLYVHRVDCVIEHLHPAWGKGASDPIYALGQKHVQRDQALFLQRAARYGLK
jgi:hypothetical protein